MIGAFVVIAGVVVGLLLTGGLFWILTRMPPSKDRLEPHSMGGDWWQNDSSGNGDGGVL